MHRSYIIKGPKGFTHMGNASRNGREDAIVIIRVAAAVVLTATLIWLALAFDWRSILSEEDVIKALEGFADAHLALAIAVYLLFVVVGGTALALPGVLFAIVAGIVFGPWLGTLLCVLGATGSAILSFLASRYLIRDLVEPRIRRSERLSKLLYGSSGRSLAVTLMITRLVPIFPFNLQNFAYGITPIPLGTYSLITFAFMIPGTAIWTFAAAGLIDDSDRIAYLSVAVALVLVILIVSWLLRKRSR